jgi:hypothetical protein
MQTGVIIIDRISNIAVSNGILRIERGGERCRPGQAVRDRADPRNVAGAVVQ